jgi:rare lipoprotein A
MRLSACFRAGRPRRSARWAGGFLPAIALLASFALLPPESANPQAAAAGQGKAAPKANGLEEGIASWYGPGFDGKKTANGEIYDKEKLTCAHRTLPFGSFVLVRDLDNGTSVVVRVNDRGPFAKNRVIDLSEAAARILGMLPSGTARVSLSLVPKEEALAWKGGGLDGQPPSALGNEAGSASPASALPDGARVRIQVASYASRANAEGTLRRLELSGLAAIIEEAQGRFRVAFPDLSPAEARTVAQKLDGLGYRGYTVTTIRPASLH